MLTNFILQLRRVDEVSAQGSNTDRTKLADVTIELQIISKDVNKLISDVDVASRNLVKTQEALAHLDDTYKEILRHRCSDPDKLPSPLPTSDRHNIGLYLSDTLQYLHSSMDKQTMWLHNYRDRKDIAMSLVFNLVTQQDAANNMSIAKDMRRDSSSMNGIALLTMVFLPGTFTSVSVHCLFFLPPFAFSFNNLYFHRRKSQAKKKKKRLDWLTKTVYCLM